MRTLKIKRRKCWRCKDRPACRHGLCRACEIVRDMEEDILRKEIVALFDSKSLGYPQLQNTLQYQ